MEGLRNGIELANLRSGEIAAYGMGAFWMVYSSAMHYTGLVGKLRRDLIEMAGEEDANALLSNASRETELLASPGLAVGIWKVLRGEISRDEFLEQYGHRGPHEGEEAEALGLKLARQALGREGSGRQTGYKSMP